MKKVILEKSMDEIGLRDVSKKINDGAFLIGIDALNKVELIRANEYQGSMFRHIPLDSFSAGNNYGDLSENSHDLNWFFDHYEGKMFLFDNFMEFVDWFVKSDQMLISSGY